MQEQPNQSKGTDAARVPHPGMRFREFVVLMAALMAVNALAIDMMLPALPYIGAELGIADENRRQWVLAAYLLGFGGAQLFLGTLSDRYGRKAILFMSLALYVVCSFTAAFAPSFEILIAARVVQGLGAAASRVITVSIIRDCYSGRQMARVMSLAFIVFLMMPAVAPGIGQLVMLIGPWRWIFAGLGIFATVLMLWVFLRLPETLAPERRLPIELDRIAAALRTVLVTRAAIGYTMAMTFVIGGLFGFINSVQQIFSDVFGWPNLFTAVFAFMALSMASASFINSQIVMRYGMRRISHIALIGYVAVSLLNLAIALSGLHNVWTFAILMCATMFCFGMTTPNFGAMAMEPVGHIAGTASSLQGFISIVGGALAGAFIGQHFNGTTVPLLLGFSALGLAAILVVLWTEHGRLFQPHAQPAPKQPSV
jgi:DHA1 family bicyclomycin/chloramphenicol resistance-like MFS transporter